MIEKETLAVVLHPEILSVYFDTVSATVPFQFGEEVSETWTVVLRECKISVGDVYFWPACRHLGLDAILTS